MQQKNHTEEDYLNEIAPTLFGKRQQIHTKTPEGYFENLPGKLSQRLKSENQTQQKGKVIRLINFQNIAIAAGFALLLALIPVARHFMHESNESTADSATEFNLHLEEDIDVDVLIHYFDEEFLYANIKTHELESWQIESNIGDAAIIDYLIDDTDHLELISNYNN